MGKGKIIAGTLAGLLMAGGIAGGGYYAYKQITDRDKTIVEQHETIESLQNNDNNKKIVELTNQLAELNNQLAEKNTVIESKNSIITQKDAEIADNTLEISRQQTKIDTQTQSIQTLTEQKTQLLSAVTEIDNKINSTTDSTTIDTLSDKKTAIIAQITALNDKIKTLTKSNTDLTNQISTLKSTNEKLLHDKSFLQQQVDNLNNDVTKYKRQIEELNDKLQNNYNANINFYGDKTFRFWVYDADGHQYSYLSLLQDRNSQDYTADCNISEFASLSGTKLKSFIGGDITYKFFDLDGDFNISSPGYGCFTTHAQTQDDSTYTQSDICKFSEMSLLSADDSTPFDTSTIVDDHNYKIEVTKGTINVDDASKKISDIMFNFVITDLTASN
jgi:predicted  nucleic acid-binding Zn-ribbon protein